jgi:uncharacterized membrane protein
MLRKTIFTFISLTLTFFVHAQDSLVVKADREATGLRAEGKIWVVLLVSSTILIGLFIYLIRLDRKITRLEKK